MFESQETRTTHSNSIYLDIISTGPHYEHMKDFKKSLFKSVYKMAFLQLEDIIHNFGQSNRNGLTLPNRGYYENSASKASNSYESFSNIITFAGKRGSGKSSAMLSFLEALRHYYSYEKMTDGDLPFKIHKETTPLFSCLDCIDGSLLEHGEDIFKIVLAQMYQKFVDLEKNNGIYKDENFAYRKRELFQQLESIYRTVCDIENMGNSENLAGESYMSSLQSLSSSQKVKRDFEELIKKFTSLMKYERPGLREESSAHFVVITIDDIDLNVNNGFSMLEKIHRYCMVQNVIVLLSVDIEQMLSIVSRNFYKALPEVDKLLRDGQKQIHELSVDYLNKVMPVNYRLYMPELNNDYLSPNLLVRKENSSIKRSVFYKLYRRIEICFDSQGIKQHFYEPKSMRQLTCFYLLLGSMDRIGLHSVYSKAEMSEKEKEHTFKIWEENYRLLTADLWNRLVIEKLYTDNDVFDLCKSLTKEDVRRAKDQVVNFYNMNRTAHLYCPYIEEHPAKNTNISPYIENCSYGQLVETIYKLGRKDGGKYKPLVHYLLGYFSYSFTWVYICERHKIKANGNLVFEGGTFKRLIGQNIIDNWLFSMMPQTVVPQNKGIGENGPWLEDRSANSLKPLTNFKNILLSNIFIFPLKSKEEFKDRELYKYVAELIRDIELVFLLFANIREADQNDIINPDILTWKFDIDYSEGKEYIKFLPEIEKVPSISFEGDLNILNFVANSMDALKTLEKFEGELLSCLGSQYQLYKTSASNDNSELKKYFKDELSKHSLKTKYETWEENYGNYSLPLPIYWFDFTYNILKRVKREMSETFFVSKNTEDMFTCIQKLYESIQTQLDAQEKFYFIKDEKDSDKTEEIDMYPYPLVEQFKTCPVVAYFLESKEDAQAEKDKQAFINEIMSKIMTFSGRG